MSDAIGRSTVVNGWGASADARHAVAGRHTRADLGEAEVMPRDLTTPPPALGLPNSAASKRFTSSEGRPSRIRPTRHFE
jgi:hypothetical protein